MAHKKKGGKKSAPHSPTQANETNGKEAPPATFKEAILKGTSQELTEPVPNGHAVPDSRSAEAHAKPTNEEPPSKTDEVGPEAAPKAEPKPSDAPHPGTQAQRDSQKALEQTVHSLRGDLRTEKSRREHAEATLMVYKAASLSLAVSTLGCAALAIVAISRCGSKR